MRTTGQFVEEQALSLSEKLHRAAQFLLARISVGSTRQEWKYFTLLPVALPPAVEHQRAQRG